MKALSFTLLCSMLLAGKVAPTASDELRLLQEGDFDDPTNDIIEGADKQNAEDDSLSDQAQQSKAADQQALKESQSKAVTHRTSANVAKQSYSEFELEDLKTRYAKGEYELQIASIEPKGGPITGGTQVLVRMKNLEPFVDAYPQPKCKFGRNNLIVDAQYVKCSAKELGFYVDEGSSTVPKNNACIQCEKSPIKDKAELISFTVSLSGNFDDASSSVPYRYYNKLKVWAIYPRYGPKDGDTVVRVWGENFLDLGDNFRCNFGTRSTKANMITPNQIWCRAPRSDVVNRPMPFSVSMNRQQNSLEKHYYWYYNMQSIYKVEPDYGPVNSENKVLIKGSNFKPWDWNEQVNNQNDTFCTFGELGKSPAQVLTETELECTTPPNPKKIMTVPIAITINNQNYTDEKIDFSFYNPPSVVEAQPLQGPVAGGTDVKFYGQNFEKRPIICEFGNQNTTGKFMSKTCISCISPQMNKTGDVKLRISYVGDRFASEWVNYTYFAPPVISSIQESACGPVEGYTQISISGSNFVEAGFGKAKCIFNNTIYMNATVLSPESMVCDSPTLESLTGDYWYNISVTLDGEYISNSTFKFSYYDQPHIESVTPSLGPLEGGTVSVIKGKGFSQSNICALNVRYEQDSVSFKLINDTTIEATSKSVQDPGAVVVSVSGNSQQFVNDITLHSRDTENTFEYYQPFFIESVTPETITNEGNSPVHLKGMTFDQFKFENGSSRAVPIYCRFVEDTEEGKVIGQVSTMKRITPNEQVCYSPKVDSAPTARIELSVNLQQWHKVSTKVKFYNGPKITSVTPTYGVTKNPKSLNLTISGQNFDCPGNDCSKIKVRFTNDKGDIIIVEGSKVNSQLQCIIPKYPAPETLIVDVSMNGVDFTNSQVTYGFMDPFILQISPRLYSPKGTTKAILHGYGFVNMDDFKQKVSFSNSDQDLICKQADGTETKCTQPINVIDEHTVEVSTKDISLVSLKGSPMSTDDSFNINLMDMDGVYASNGIDLFYYNEISLDKVSSQFAFANQEKPLLIHVDFGWGKLNDLTTFKKYGNFSCRFTGQDKSVVVPAIMETTPIGGYFPENLPNQIRCRTPKWGKPEALILDISVNSFDYFGQQKLQIVDPLKAFKLSPMSGPIGGDSKIKFYGTGFQSTIPQDAPLYVRFGSYQSQPLEKKSVYDERWSSELYYRDINIPSQLLHEAEEFDLHLDEEFPLKTYLGAASPNFEQLFALDYPGDQDFGGSVYVQLSERIPIEVYAHTNGQRTQISNEDLKSRKVEDFIETVYPDSSNLEFYYYRQPFVTKVEPLSGLATGGTTVTFWGGWFKQLPEYGVFPFCKFGDKIVRGKFLTTNMIQCSSPPSMDTSTQFPISVSLNGVDFVSTNFQFTYYERPILVDIQPRKGKAEGGTEIWLKGMKFSNTQNDKNVRCRFRQVLNDSETMGENVPTKFVPAVYVDKETMKCSSPTGWNGGDQVILDLTFNGVDYTEASFPFALYNVFGYFPKSGPTEGSNQNIQVKGKGFDQTWPILCVLNGVEIAPVKVEPNLIKCPMVLPSWPVDKYETVDFYITVDGIKHPLGNFHYYKQVEISNVNPLIGPNQGNGAIYVMGRYFRTDFENSKLKCRIGNTLTKALLIDSETVRCLIDKQLPLIDEGQKLLVSVALNSYSWAASEFGYQPYGVLNIFPSSGPINDNTNINVLGKGFNNELIEQARCKFGTDDNYQIVEAQVLDDERLICKSPSDSLVLPEFASEEISIPFSIAFQDDIYYPYTQGFHKFRMYPQPVTIGLDPLDAEVGKLTEVYVYASAETPFKQPVPPAGKNILDSDNFGLKCKFGRFGTSQATYINETTLLCLTPTIQEEPAEIGEEIVTVSIAMNGVDFNDDLTQCRFTFVGTGSSLSIWVILLATLVFGLLIISIMIFVVGLKTFWGKKGEIHANVELNQDGLLQPRTGQSPNSSRLYAAASRRSAAYRGRQSAASRMRSAQGSQARFAGAGSQQRYVEQRFQQQ